MFEDQNLKSMVRVGMPLEWGKEPGLEGENVHSVKILSSAKYSTRGMGFLKAWERGTTVNRRHICYGLLLYSSMVS